MPFGILDDHKLDSVPGTCILSSKDAQLTTGDATGLKRGTGKHSDVVLLPQPSDDPCDPLNWPRWRKETCFWTLVFMTGLADTLLLLTTPGYFLLAKEFDVSVNAVASSFSTVFVGVSAFMLLLVPISVKYGYRIVYLFSAFLMFMTCIWAALSPNLTSIRVARIFQGFAIAATRCLVANMIEHLFFVHERGLRSSIWMLCQAIGEIMGVLINGYVIQLLSWRHGFWFAGIACGLCFICVLLFVPETTYHRREASSKQESACENSKVNADSEKAELETVPRIPPSGKLNVDPNPSSPNSHSSISYLKIYNGTFSDESMLSIFLGLFPFILSPVTWFSFVSASIPSILFLVVSSCSSTIFTVTYGFNAGQIGLTNAGAIVGIVLALLIAGPLHDWWIIWMARRNRGIYEPEFRLVFTLSMLVGALSYMGWAIGNDNHMPWIGAVACVAINNFTISVATATRVAYVIDAHGANAAHILTLTECVMYLVTYAATFFSNGIVLSAGVRRTLLVVAAIQAACWLTCVPVYVFGKRVRSFIARHPRLFRGDALGLAAPDTGADSESPNLNSQGRTATACEPDSKCHINIETFEDVGQ